jgi:HSP20 family molecular chaperone IbpA
MYVSKEYNLHIAGEKTHMEEYERVIEYPKTADMGKLKATLVDGLVSVYGEQSLKQLREAGC